MLRELAEFHERRTSLYTGFTGVSKEKRGNYTNATITRPKPGQCVVEDLQYEVMSGIGGKTCFQFGVSERERSCRNHCAGRKWRGWTGSAPRRHPAQVRSFFLIYRSADQPGRAAAITPLF